jgi:hypothetical protein
VLEPLVRAVWLRLASARWGVADCHARPVTNARVRMTGTTGIRRFEDPVAAPSRDADRISEPLRRLVATLAIAFQIGDPSLSTGVLLICFRFPSSIDIRPSHGVDVTFSSHRLSALESWPRVTSSEIVQICLLREGNSRLRVRHSNLVQTCNRCFRCCQWTVEHRSVDVIGLTG